MGINILTRKMGCLFLREFIYTYNSCPFTDTFIEELYLKLVALYKRQISTLEVRY